MDVKELRIGNYIMTHEVVIVKALGESPVDDMPELAPIYFEGKEENGFDVGAEFKPIPLTEEILLKCGLSLTNWFCEGSYLIVKDKDFGWCMKVRNANHTTQIEFGYFKYLHQLQNIYFALTGKELEIEFE